MATSEYQFALVVLDECQGQQGTGEPLTAELVLQTVEALERAGLDAYEVFEALLDITRARIIERATHANTNSN